MAAGDQIRPEQFFVDVQEALHNLETGSFKVGLITSTVTPTATDADPRWGAGGSTNYATNEVTAGGNYSAGGPALANPTVTLVSNKGEFDADDVSIAQDALNPTDARWAVVYNDDANKRVVTVIDLGAVIDLSAGAFSITWNANGIHTIGLA